VLVIADRGPLMIGRSESPSFLVMNRLPSIPSFCEHVQAGGLMAYAVAFVASVYS